MKEKREIRKKRKVDLLFFNAEGSYWFLYCPEESAGKSLLADFSNRNATELIGNPITCPWWAEAFILDEYMISEMMFDISLSSITSAYQTSCLDREKMVNFLHYEKKYRLRKRDWDR